MSKIPDSTFTVEGPPIPPRVRLQARDFLLALFEMLPDAKDSMPNGVTLTCTVVFEDGGPMMTGIMITETPCAHEWRSSWGGSGPIMVCDKCGTWEHD